MRIKSLNPPSAQQLHENEVEHMEFLVGLENRFLEPLRAADWLLESEKVLLVDPLRSVRFLPFRHSSSAVLASP